MRDEKKKMLVSNLFKEQLHTRSIQVLEHLIVSGEFRENELLPSERKLSESLGVSRTVIREAMKILEVKGLVKIEHGKGTIVRKPSHDPVSDALSLYMKRTNLSYQYLSEFRLIVEGEMTALAAKRATEEDLQKMKRTIEEMKKYFNSDDQESSHGFVHADDEFHMHICRASKNDLMIIVFESINDIIKASRYLTLNENGKRRGIQEHEEIVQAIEEKDSQKAKEIMRYHLLHTEKDFYEVQLQPQS